MDSDFPNMSPEAAKHISGFISTFVDKAKRRRWRTVLTMKTDKWVGASAYDCTEEPVADWNTPVADTLAKHGLMSVLDDKAYIFPIGNGAKDGAYEGSLRQALLSDDSQLECVVSIVPGKLAVCYGGGG